MLKELRSWLQMSDYDFAAEEEEAIATGAATAGAGAAASPCSFIFDPDADAAKALAGMLAASGMTAARFSCAESFLAGLGIRDPELVFIDVSARGEGAVDALYGLGERRFTGGVQLMGHASVQVIETIRRMGERHELDMLPALGKPLSITGVRRVLEARNISGLAAAAGPVDLGEALASDWLEFWYQPKIDLRKRRIASVETFARLRHPLFGLVPPGEFMRGAGEAELLALSEKALVSALTAARNFSQLGVNLRLAVNVPVSAVLKLPLDRLVETHGPHNLKWPGLLLDVSEAELMNRLPEVEAASARLASFGIKLAIDDFGRGHLPLNRLRELAFAELKLDRSFVNDCALDLARASVCRSVIDLAHHMGCVAVAIGVENAADMQALADMNCDLGQGYFFGPPMPERDLVALMLKRAVTPEAARPQPTPAAATRVAPAAKARLRRARWN
jgi:EAL domain-containing protein (putative c-di-GMP-specific phosphodiesterase class I)